jgi:hypothetical protein
VDHILVGSDPDPASKIMDRIRILLLLWIGFGSCFKYLTVPDSALENGYDPYQK